FVGQVDGQKNLVAPPDIALRICLLRAQSLGKANRFASFSVGHKRDVNAGLSLELINNRSGDRFVDAGVEDDFVCGGFRAAKGEENQEKCETGEERWDPHAQPLNCHFSTLTLLSRSLFFVLVVGRWCWSGRGVLLHRVEVTLYRVLCGLADALLI